LSASSDLAWYVRETTARPGSTAELANHPSLAYGWWTGHIHEDTDHESRANASDQAGCPATSGPGSPQRLLADPAPATVRSEVTPGARYDGPPNIGLQPTARIIVRKMFKNERAAAEAER
jgi:hypothetical protein